MLRDYQKAAVDAAINAPEGIHYIVAPTGSGKSYMIRALYSLVEGAIVVVNERSVKTQLGIPVVGPNSPVPPDCPLVIIDEVHHYRSDRAWGKWFACRKVVGFTATPIWDDGDIIYAISNRQLGRSRELSARIVTALPPVDGHQVCYIASKEDWTPAHGRLITAETPSEERHFLPGERRICNIATLTTGWDDPDIDAVILCRRVGEAHTYVQIIGRLRRGGVIYDLSDNVMRFGLDEDAIITSKLRQTSSGVPTLVQCFSCQRLIGPRTRRCPHCGAELPPPDAQGRLWRRTDIHDWLNILYCPRRVCKFTKSGAWPKKLPNGEDIYLSVKTWEFHWSHVARILAAIADEEAYYIPHSFFILLRRPDRPLYYINIDWGSDLAWRGFDDVI